MAIYARLENGTYAEVTGVYKTDGTEITEIFQGDRLVYSATNEIYGTLPLYYNGRGYELIDYLISGNTVQDGTPSPDAPVDAVGCGVRTDNLLYGDAANGMIVPCFLKKGATYTCSLTVDGTVSGTPPQIILYDKEKKQSDYWTLTSHNNIRLWRSFRPIDDVYYAQIRANDVKGIRDVTVVSGSEKYSFIPYGYKLPLTVNGVEYPIFLGQCQTTRRIAVKVFTGNETFNNNFGTHLFSWPSFGRITMDQSSLICSHAVYNPIQSGLNVALKDGEFAFQHLYGSISFKDERFTAPGAFKSYLAQQYANGTPVMVWYVLKEPETAIVNEPLMKIGNYADTISFAQSGVTIPTVNGANVLDMTSPVKPSEVYIKGKGIKPTGYGQLADVNGVNILDKDGRPIYVHGQ